MSDKIRLACVQLTGTDKAANLEQAERLVARAAATGADSRPPESERDRRSRRSA